MKTLERIPLLSYVLSVACSRPNAEVGKLVKAIVKYASDGIKPDLDDVRLEVLFDLIANDLDTQREAAEVKSRKCSESAKCRTAKNTIRPNSAAKKTNAVLTSQPADAEDTADEENSTNGEAGDEDPGNADDADSSDLGDFNANEITSSFLKMKAVYGKTGDNESSAFGIWRQLKAEERTAAFTHACRKQGDPSPRSYLYVYLRDREWKRADDNQ